MHGPAEARRVRHSLAKASATVSPRHLSPGLGNIFNYNCALFLLFKKNRVKRGVTEWRSVNSETT